MVHGKGGLLRGGYRNRPINSYTFSEYTIMDWIIENKDWLFSGVAIAAPLAIIGWFITTRGNKQVQKGGKN